MLRQPLGRSAAYRLLAVADIAFANLEVPFSLDGHPADKPITHRADPALAAHLKRLGLDVVSFANNHSLDQGIPALLETLRVVTDAGVAVVGAGADLRAALRPHVLTVSGGRRVAFLAVSSTLPTGSAATPQRPGVAPVRVEASLLADAAVFEEQPGTSPYVATRALAQDVSRLRRAIRRARRDADVVVVSIHWGVPPGWAAPFQGLLADYQRPLGHALIDAGADLVLGHHPHTLHGIEVYRGGLICYSLGNFIFHSLAPGTLMRLERPMPPYRLEYVRPAELMESAVFIFTRRGRRWELMLVPCAFDRAGECRPVRGHRAEAILRRVADHSEGLGTQMRIAHERGYIVTAK